MKEKVCRQIAGLMLALACVCMWGCSDDVSMRWSEERSLGNVVGFVDDSLAIVNTSRYWHEEVEPALGPSYDHSGYAHPGLSLYNYRVQLDGPVWSDSLDNSRDDDFEYIKGQLSDSVIWGGDPKSEVSFWKIGEKPHKMKIKKLFDGCSVEVSYTTKLRPWFDGKILVMGERSVPPDVKGFDMDSLGREYCQYAELDTIQKQIIYKRLVGDLKWIKKCDDVRVWGDDLYCLTLKGEPINLYLMRNAVYLDSLLQGKPYGWTYYTKVGFAGDMLNLGNNVCRIVNDDFLCIGVSIRSALEFSNENGNSVTY